MSQSILLAIAALAFHVAPIIADATVLSSFLFLRTGDRTPVVLGSAPTLLTPLGSQQLFSVGEFFRARYITNALTTSNTTSPLNNAPISDIEVHQSDEEQLYMLALDAQYSVGSAIAFMQGLYPPFTIMTGGNGGNLGEGDGIVGAGTLDGLGLLGNGSYIEAPLSGYQYPHLRVASPQSYSSIYTGGSQNCPALDQFILNDYSNPDYAPIAASTSSLYEAIGSAFLQDVAAPPGWSYYNAYAVYEYMSFLYMHNTTVHSAFTNSVSGWLEENSTYSDLDRLRWLADAQMTTFLGNLSATNPYGTSLTAATSGGISTIAGATLAAKVVTQLSGNIVSGGSTNKLNILVGDFDAFTSFFALAGLTTHSTNFLGLPTYGSVMAFELISYANTSDSSYPDESDLWIRFLFRNGTDESTFTTSNDSVLEGLQAYPLFGRGPSETDMPWTDFLSRMQDIAINGPGDWCQMCGSAAFWCAAWNSSDAFTYGVSSDGKGSHSLSPAVAGVVGAVVALAVTAVLAGLAFAVAGVRVHRVSRNKLGAIATAGPRDLGGFKGRNKLRSDPDLTLPKSNFVGATVERKSSVGSADDDLPPGARERVGSWEMKETDIGIGRIGFERSASTESLGVGGLPVRPEERV